MNGLSKRESWWTTPAISQKTNKQAQRWSKCWEENLPSPPPVYHQYFITRSYLFNSQKLTSFAKCRHFNLKILYKLPEVELLSPGRVGPSCTCSFQCQSYPHLCYLLCTVVLHHRGSPEATYTVAAVIYKIGSGQWAPFPPATSIASMWKL